MEVFWGDRDEELIVRGAYTWRGLFPEFYGSSKPLKHSIVERILVYKR